VRQYKEIIVENNFVIKGKRVPEKLIGQAER